MNPGIDRSHSFPKRWIPGFLALGLWIPNVTSLVLRIPMPPEVCAAGHVYNLRTSLVTR